MSTLQAVIFDYTTLEDVPEAHLRELQDLLSQLKRVGLKLAVFSNNPVNLDETLKRRALPAVDLLLTKADVGKSKGAKVWIERAAADLGCAPHKMLYVGDSFNDWTTAINSAVMYLQAKWSEAGPLGKTSLSVDSPRGVWVFATHFLLQPPRWQYTLDEQSTPSNLRCLLNASARLPGKIEFEKSSTNTFELKNIFTHRLDVQVGTWSGRDALMTHAISSLYLEGLLPQGTFFAAYPSHTPGKSDPILDDWLRPAAKIFHGWFKDDLLVRVHEAPDTSLRRSRGESVTPEMQMSTVRVNPKYKAKLGKRTVVLVDDFTTKGTSLEWGCRLLLAAGAKRVVLLAVGKFGQSRPLKHSGFAPKTGVTLDPYTVTDVAHRELFNVESLSLEENMDAALRIERSLAKLQENVPYPLNGAR